MKPLSRALVASPLILALAACGGEEVAPELGLEGPSSVLVNPGLSTPVELVLKRNETATGDVTFDITGLPDGVTATFEPATLADGAPGTTLHLEAARESERGASLVTVRALGADELFTERQFALEVRGITVEGRLDSMYLGLPPEPTPVRIGSRSTITNEDGVFSIEDVALPYDLEVLSPELYQRFEGITSSSPRVSSLVSFPAGMAESAVAALDGTISPAPGADEEVQICASSSGRVVLPSCETLSAGETDFSMNFRLLGTPSAEVLLVARRTLFQGGAAAGFNGYAEGQVTLSSAGASAVLTLEDSGSEPIPVALVPHDFENELFEAATSFGPLLFINRDLDTAEPVVHVPDNGSAVVHAQGHSDFGNQLALIVQPLSGPLDEALQLPPMLRLLSPDDGATLTRDSVFVIEPADEGVHSFLLQTDGIGGMMVHTTADRIALSDLGIDVNPADLRGWGILHEVTARVVNDLVEGGSSFTLFFSSQFTGRLPPIDRRHALSGNFNVVNPPPVISEPVISDGAPASMLGRLLPLAR